MNMKRDIHNPFRRMIDWMVKELRHIRISTRLILSYVVVSIIPVLTIGGFSYYVTQKVVLEKMHNSLTQSIRSINVDSNRYLDELLQNSNNMIYSAYAQQLLKEYQESPDKEEVARRILDHMKSNSLVSSLSDIRIAVDHEDVISYRVVYRLRSEEMERLEQIGEANEESPVFVPVKLESNQRGISLVRTIYSSSSLKEIGKLYYTVTEKGIQDICNGIEMEEGSNVYVISGDGDVVSSSGTVAFEPEEILEKAGQKSRGKFDMDIQGQKCFVTFSKMDQADWYIVCTVPYSSFNSAVSKLRLYIMTCVIICVFFCSFCTVLIHRSISLPLTNLRRHMLKAGNDALPKKLEDHNRDEIADVTQSYNNMVDEITKLVEDIHISEQQKSMEKLKALQAQINPHFISNTLNTIRWMASIQNAENIENLTVSLIQLLQVNMGKVEDLVTLKEEIDYVQSYVDIQSFKYWDKFTVEYDIDQEAGMCLLPPFSIQPIVENAIIHGIEPKAGKGTIWISASRVGDDVICMVKDDGVGLEEDKLDDGGKKHVSGIGIRNVDERIKMHFGADYGIVCESIPGIYTKVKLRLPYIRKE